LFYWKSFCNSNQRQREAHIRECVSILVLLEILLQLTLAMHLSSKLNIVSILVLLEILLQQD